MKLNKEELTDEELEAMEEAGSVWICSGSDELYDSEEDGTYIHDEWYSYEYLQGSYDFFQCNDCGEWMASDEDIYVENDGVSICEDCYNNGYYFRCEDCGDVFSGDGNYTDDERVLCDGCYDDYEYYHDEGKDARIYHYHGFSDWTPFKLEDEVNPYFIGFELEIVCKNKSNTSGILDVMEEAWPVVFMEDGSLDDGGVEIISHPFTMKYFEKNKHKLQDAFDKIIKLGGISHDARCCGLHFHFTRPKKDDAIDKMWLVLETYKNEVIKLSRRDEGSFNHWTAMLSSEGGLKTKTLDFINEAKSNCGRYKALNNTNTKTIEFRLYRGTLNFETFVASLEFVNNLYRACISSKDLCKINWQYLTKTKYINKYVNKNDIKSDAIVKDYGVEYNKLLQKANKHLNNAIILLKQGYTEEMSKIGNSNVIKEDVDDAIYQLNNIAQFLKYLKSCKYYKDFNNFYDFNYYLKNACSLLQNNDLKSKINHEVDVIDEYIKGGI